MAMITQVYVNMPGFFFIFNNYKMSSTSFILCQLFSVDVRFSCGSYRFSLTLVGRFVLVFSPWFSGHVTWELLNKLYCTIHNKANATQLNIS